MLLVALISRYKKSTRKKKKEPLLKKNNGDKKKMRRIRELRAAARDFFGEKE